MNRTAAPLACFALALGFGVLAAGDPKPAYPPPPPPTDDEHLGAGVQRTMSLLATSSPKHHNKVRILFYGQSITEQEWSKKVADDLRQSYPNADLEVENRAIGGFASQLLIRPAEHDVYPYYPDLVIFHVYGSDKEYEQIVKSIRSRTTAEVLMQKDHVTQWPPAVIDKDKDKGAWWDDLMNNHRLPEIARKYGCGLVDVRTPWLAYLKANQYEPKDLLKDGVHLNDQGDYLMAALVGRYLRVRLDLKDDGWKDLAKTLEAKKDFTWDDGKLTLEFEGNRVDVLALNSEAKTAPIHVKIDGKKPSEFPEAYSITRPTPGPWSPLAVTRVDHDKPLALEEWTLKITSVKDDGKRWEFEVGGSVTGADGKGSNGETFTSQSGRVKIEPDSWFRNGKEALKEGYEIKWNVLPMFVDTYDAPKVDDPARDYATTLVQGISNNKHTLELTAEGDGVIAVQAIRVYKPPVK